MNSTNSTNNIAQAPEGEGKHQHVCVHCHVPYVHYHPHKKADHPQFDYQCPNAECAHFYGKRPDASSPSTTIPAKSGDAPRPAETYKQRTVRIMYQDGRLDCGNASHYRLTSKPGDQYKTPSPLPARDILEAMKIGVDAQCACERKAIREAWGWNRAGVFETEWVTPGSYHKGYGKYEPTMAPRRVMPLHFSPSREDIEHLHKVHPGWLFVSVSGDMHDHGVAHATTQIGTYNLLHSLPKGRYLDLHGSPNSNEQFNLEKNGRHMETLVNIESAKDVLRSRTKWGPQKVGDKTRYHVGALRDLARDNEPLLKSVDGCVSIHTLYYYAPEEIPEFLAKTKGKTLTAMLHRFKGESGTMNNGEQKWRRVPSETGGIDWIEQTNVRTGEVYSHPDPERWFNNHSWTPTRDLSKLADNGTYDVENSLVWDGNMCADGTFKIVMTTCTPRQALLDTSYKPEVVPVLPAKNSEEYVERYGHVALDGLTGVEKVPVPAIAVDLFRESRRRMLGADRNAAKFRSHSQYVAIKSKSIMGGARAVNDIQVVYDVAYASFWVDAPRDRRLMAAMHGDLRKQVVDMMVTALSCKSFATGAAEVLRQLRHHV